MSLTVTEVKLLQASFSDEIHDLEKCLAEGVNINAKSDSGITALMYAADRGNTQSANKLIESGADVNATDNDNWTALMYAASDQGHLACVELLIKHGANLEAENTNMQTCLIVAAGSDSDEGDCMRLLVDKGANINRLKASHQERYRECRAITEAHELKQTQIKTNKEKADSLGL